MKKLCIFLLASLMLFSFVACDDQPQAPEDLSVEFIQNVTTGKKYFNLKQAFEEVKEDEELKLLKDISITTADLPISFKNGKIDGLGFSLPNGGVFNGDGHKIYIGDSDMANLHTNIGFFYNLKNATVKNCVFEFAFDRASTTVYARENVVFENVKVEGEFEFINNCGSFVIYAYAGKENSPIVFKNCEAAANINANATAYCAAFVGYALPTYSKNNVIIFNDCTMTGSLTAGTAGVFIGNTSQIQLYPYELHVNNFKFGENAQVKFINTTTNWNFNGLVGASNYKNAKVLINDAEYTYEQLVEKKSELWGDHFYYAKADPDLKLVKTEGEDTFTLTKSKNSDIASYEISLKAYTSLIENGSLYQGVTETIEASAIEGDSIETKLRDLKFVDNTWVENNKGAKKGELAGNVIYTLGEETFYMIPNSETATLHGNPKTIDTYIVSAFDANGKLVASCSLTK